MKLVIFALLFSTVTAFISSKASPARAAVVTELAAERREFLSAAAAAVAFVGMAAPANAIRDYENIKYLGGGSMVDINNANVRAYLKFPGMYPTVAGKIASHGPYASVGDLYNIPGLSARDKEIIKKYEAKFTAQPPSADYVIDRINNGLYK